MKKEIFNDSTIFNLKHYKDKILLLDERMYEIRDFKLETEEVTIPKTWFTKEKTKTITYLTGIKMVSYFKNHKVLGTLHEEDAYRIVLFYDLPKLRKNWLDFVEQLKHFGGEIRTIKKETKKD